MLKISLQKLCFITKEFIPFIETRYRDDNNNKKLNQYVNMTCEKYVLYLLITNLRSF